ncbi:prephenate dehydratase [Methanobrevibacter filiformis]|uniref:prephenate dehydratase n=1 Tax=Methanobrevibacter filiformis TaxID=55758 RepID=A0A166APJ3_9EURY|nr:prephenate dehydratase [Methanobrevibacter filiformis]KZX12303.1 prephenate dehydratase [Methanobrevibacter filiformis]
MCIKPKIAFLGPKGTFTHEVASTLGDDLRAFCSVDVVMDSINNGCDFGVVPIENSTEGQVGTTLDALVQKNNVKIYGERVIPINQNLLSSKGTKKENIVDVYSHAQALAQCQAYVTKNNMNPHFTLSTAAAAKSVKKINNSGAIGTLKAAELYDLEIVDTNIQDLKNNETRFVILSREDHPITGNDKTSILFSLSDDKPGDLNGVLSIFAANEINLTKIESRPSKKGLGKYIFFVDFEGHRSDEMIKYILNIIKTKTSFIKILGSYPNTMI